MEKRLCTWCAQSQSLSLQAALPPSLQHSQQGFGEATVGVAAACARQEQQQHQQLPCASELSFQPRAVEHSPSQMSCSARARLHEASSHPGTNLFPSIYISRAQPGVSGISPQVPAAATGCPECGSVLAGLGRGQGMVASGGLPVWLLGHLQTWHLWRVPGSLPHTQRHHLCSQQPKR